jgi:hypothetical protein
MDSPTQISAEAKKLGYNISAKYVSIIKHGQGKKKAKGKRKVATAGHNGFDPNSIVVVAATVKKLGSVENVRQALALIEKVSGALA